MKMNVLVTGATGLLGNNVLRQLLDAGHHAQILVRPTSDLRAIDGLCSRDGTPIGIHQGDVTDKISIRKAASKATHIIHSAADIHIGWKGLDRQRHVNVSGSRNVGEIAKEFGIPMVHVSTVNTLGLTGTKDPANEETPFGKHNLPTTYVVSKKEADEEIERLRDNGLNATIVYPGFMFGPNDWRLSSGRMLTGLAQGLPLASPRGGCSLCDARDVADGIIKALLHETPNQGFILAGHNLSYLELWRAISKEIGSIYPLFRMGPLVVKGSKLFCDLSTRITGKEGTVNSGMLGMSEQWHYYSSDKAIQLLDYKVRPVDQIISDAWTWLCEQGIVKPKKSKRPSKPNSSTKVSV
jgi:dihydroflavonol-4-reductase